MNDIKYSWHLRSDHNPGSNYRKQYPFILAYWKRRGDYTLAYDTNAAYMYTTAKPGVVILYREIPVGGDYD